MKRVLVIAIVLFAASVAAQPTNSTLDGFADIHVHQMADVGFGGSIIWGRAGGDWRELGPIPRAMRRGHDGVEGATHGRLIPKVLRTFVNAWFGDWFRHGEKGNPGFESWPSVDMWTHQQVYKDWLFREYQGGLRLMVMLAANSEDMFGRGEDEIPIIRHNVIQETRAENRSSNDMESLDYQILAAYRLQTEIDAEFGGRGKGWYRIVRDPDEASHVVSEGKLAVILGVELQHLFNCDIDRPACTRRDVIEGLDRLEAMGINYVFPVHHKLNQFAGPARFQLVNNGPHEDCPSYSPHYTHNCSAVGLTELGRFLVEELTSRGMLIDTEHMSLKTFNDSMAIVESRQYPVLAGHVVPFDLAVNDDRTERAKTRAQLLRIFKSGGIVAPMLGTAVDPDAADPAAKRVPIVCRPVDGGSVDQWANAYLFIEDLRRDAGNGAVALGSDFNGFAGWPGPREHCAPRTERRITYPFALPLQLRRAAIDPVKKLPIFDWPQGVRTWDFYRVGTAHAGMVPDFLETLRLLCHCEASLTPIYQSARAVVDLWTRARTRPAEWSRQHLRWAPQRLFDVLNDRDAFDPTRTIDGPSGFPICRSRSGHRLGFVRDDVCTLVERSPDVTSEATEVRAFHDGQCLTGASWTTSPLTQRVCSETSSQRWLFNAVGGMQYRIENSLTRRCIAPGSDHTIVEGDCRAEDLEQVWAVARFGNTFQIRSTRGDCLELRDQSRAPGERVRTDPCGRAAFQLWSIEQLRRNDYEMLYQADREGFEWSDAPLPGSTAVEAAPGRAICRADMRTLGVVVGQRCVGKDVDGGIVNAAPYAVLYQR